MGSKFSDNPNNNNNHTEVIGEQETSRKNEGCLCQCDGKSFKTSNQNHKTIHSSCANEGPYSNPSETKMRKYQIAMQKRSSWKNGSIIRNREDQTIQESSCSKRHHSVSEMFEFWGLKQSERTKNISNLNSSQNSNFSGRMQATKLTKKSFSELSSKHTIQKDTHSQMSDSNIENETNEDQQICTRAVIIQRRRKRDIFPDRKIFFQVDRHVLLVSQQEGHYGKATSKDTGWNNYGADSHVSSIFITKDVLEHFVKMKSDSELSVEKIVHQILGICQTELEKIRAIWIWLCNNIEYDISGYLGLSKKMHTPQCVLQSRKGVCSGYSSLFQELCREAGITCIEVPGHGKGIGYNLGHSYQNKKSSHMWNAVQVDKQWYLLDACWAAGVVDMEHRVFIQRYDDHYFLTDPEEFIDSHWPDDPKWQLMDSVISLEDFEQRVFKTSAFYRLGLSLISPKRFLLQTVYGEAAVCLASVRPVEFSYSITQISEVRPSHIDTSCGIMRAMPSRMELRVIPPSRGKYDLKIFSKPLDSKESFTWVCSYQVDCPEPKIQGRLPDNPFSFWGLHWRAKCMGISSCNCSEGLIEAPEGYALLHFQTSRPLSATYKLIHKDSESDVSKRCVVSQIGEGKLICKIVLLAKGYYRLSVFIKAYNQEGPYQNICNCLIDCLNPVNQNELFPSNLSNHCGPGIRTKEIGLTQASHPEPIINVPHGKCNITFQTAQNVEVTAKLTRDEASTESYPLERHTLCSNTKNKVNIGISLPASGVYKLGIFARPEDEEDFEHICDYVVRYNAELQWPPFPQMYSTWKKGCVLFEPRSGELPANEWVRFCVRIPGAHRVFVIGESVNELSLSKSQVWEGTVLTGLSRTQLKLAANLDRLSPVVSVMSSFDVGRRPPHT